MRVQSFGPRYLPGLRTPVNHRLSAVVPGWALQATRGASVVSKGELVQWLEQTSTGSGGPGGFVWPARHSRAQIRRR